MPSFDITSKLDNQKLDNSLNIARKEITSRYDFKDSATEIQWDKKSNNLVISTESEMRVNAVQDIIISKMLKQGLDPSGLDTTPELYPSGKLVKKEIKLKQGIEKDTSKKIVKAIKDSGLKVQASIMDDQIRVTGKKIDDLQAVMALVRKSDFGQPLQFENMKS